MVFRPSLLQLVLPVIILAAACLGRHAVGMMGYEEDLVVGLPGQPEVGFRQYAGYVRVRPEDEKALFYWYFEADAAGDSSSKPVLLWLNGGPGCSSVAYGAAHELGPFLVRSDGPNLTYNPYAWNKVANLLFVEAPVGVGYSYTNRSSDLERLGDNVTAKDSYDFLVNWFRKFPHLKSNDFYLSGESYAGHYVPQLANLIFDGNKDKDKDHYSHINFKGFMIGNSVINRATDDIGMVEFAWGHGIISDHAYYKIIKHCGDFSSNSDSCSSAIIPFSSGYDGIDIYSIYTPVCLHSKTTVGSNYRNHLNSHVSDQLFFPTIINRFLPVERAGYDPCAEGYIVNYFNRADVQKALHANTTKLSYPYTSCSNAITTWNDNAKTVLPIIRKLIGAGVRIWIYSGDTDGRVPFTSTRHSLKKMNLKTEKAWRTWYHQKQVAGWVMEYEHGLTFATVRGAGHQVPVLAPAQSLSLITHFLASGAPLPTK